MNLISSREWAEAKRSLDKAQKDLDKLKEILFKEESDMTMRILQNLINVNKVLMRKLEWHSLEPR